jgi:hypothetical protein
MRSASQGERTDLGKILLTPGGSVPDLSVRGIAIKAVESEIILHSDVRHFRADGSIHSIMEKEIDTAIVCESPAIWVSNLGGEGNDAKGGMNVCNHGK